MPILGLFPTGRESDYQGYVDERAGGAETAATRELRQSGELARRQAFASAYASRGNQALARRQANQEATQATLSSGAQVANQKLRDIEAAKMEQQRLEQQRVAGINNAIGFAAQGAGMLLGGPALGAGAKAVKTAGSLAGSLAPMTQNTQQAAPQPARSAFSMDSLPGMSAQDARQQLVGNGPPAPVQPRADLQQYMMPAQAAAPTTPQVGIDPNDPYSGLMTADQALTNEYLLQGLDPNFVQGMTRNAASRPSVRRRPPR